MGSSIGKCLYTGSLLLLLAAASSAAWAHHSFGMFDMHNDLTIEGTVKDFQWTNPHVWLDVVVDDPTTHKQVLWSVECESVAGLAEKGWTRDALKAGDKVAVVLHPLRNGNIGGSLNYASKNGVRIGHTPP